MPYGGGRDVYPAGRIGKGRGRIGADLLEARANRSAKLDKQRVIC
jgi:hypothetical protein